MSGMDFMKKIKELFHKNWEIFAVFLIVFLYLFSNCAYGYKLSFTNINYTMVPYSSYAIKTQGPLLSDVADHEYPLIYEAYYSGDVSLWNSDAGLGIRSNTVASLLNPMQWVYFLPFGVAIFLKVFSEFLLGFLGMYLFLKEIGIRSFPSVIAGIVYTFSSAIVVWLGWAHSDVAVLAPFLFWAIEKLISTIKIKYVIALAVIVYVMLIVGMPTYAAYFMYLAGVYVVVFTCIRYWRQKKNILIVGMMFAVGVVLGILISLPYTVELLEQVASNGYADSRKGQASLQLPLEYIRTFIYPYIRDGFSMHMNESTLYIGIFPLALLPLGIIRSNKKNIFFLFASAVVFCLIFTDWLNAIYTKLPAINTSVKFRVIVLLMFTLSVLVGITLNDIIENGKKYLRNKWLFLIYCLGFGVMLCTSEISKNYVMEFRKVIILFIISAVCIMVLFEKNRKEVKLAILAVVILDSVGFAREYLPWISAEASVIPEPTDSVEYMIENTTEHERIVSMGSWTFFPNTPSLYQINDIGLHDFCATNEDMQKYYTEIESSCYQSPTRTSFSDIENYQLLKYIGVKYVYNQNSINVENAASLDNAISILGQITNGTSIQQEIELSKDLVGINIMMATYKTVPTSEKAIEIYIADLETEEILAQGEVRLCEVFDNQYVNIQLDNSVKAGRYKFILYVEDVDGELLTFRKINDESKLFLYNNQNQTGSLYMQYVYGSNEYSTAYVGEDGMCVYQMNEYADKAELVENVFLCSSKEDILAQMKEKYIDNSIFLIANADDTLEYCLPLTENESIELVTYEDDYIKIKCSSEYERYISINDYYDKDWIAYVNGEKVNIEKANYLLRAVKIPAGEDIVVEMKYVPQNMYICYGVACVGLILLIGLYLGRKYVEKAYIREIC